MKTLFLKEVPGVQVDLQGGRVGSFEITVNGNLVHSKLSGQGWPEQRPDLVSIVKKIKDS